MNKDIIKKADELQPIDLETYPVWEFIDDDELCETAMRPVKNLPVDDLGGKLVGLKIFLANGLAAWGLIGNVRVDNPQLTEHLITVGVERNRKWFTLARYHDPDYESSGPVALAKFLGLGIDDVFPVKYDLSAYSKGNPAALKGVIRDQPAVRLSRADLIRLSVPRR